ncbi:hypothetical protein [Neptunomonas japonica]|uniref:Uncharacterized protein n=1 Tax=Neptunomonas japonica JAMM 1380 TaxID=1441457 RepID=A0A7R6PRX7_9GAMM|nr:hypothetical protein [Neptunomonas japonica]BBB31497.1 hypothetical protein NEJAP_3559 [Neptunomonas japonica JAMM 1380]
MSSSDKLSFEDTKRLLDHACSASPNTNAAKIADFLNEPASRISEGRSKGWRLKVSDANKLIEKYGQPKGKPGLFVRAEERGSIKSFLEHESSTSKSRHLKRVWNLYHSVHFLNSLADKIMMVGDQLWPTYEEFAEDGDELLNMDERDAVRKARAHKRDTSAKFRKEKLDKLFTMMKTPEFSQWLSAAGLYLDKLLDAYDIPVDAYGIPEIIFRRMGATGYYGINDIHNITPDGDNNHLSSEGTLNQLLEEHGLKSLPFLEVNLFLFGTLEQYFREFEEPATKATLISQTDEVLIELREYVITGKEIWSQESKFTIPRLGEAAIGSIFSVDGKSRANWISSLHQNDIGLSSLSKKDVTSLFVDHWTTYKVSLFLKDNCDYALMLSLGSYESSFSDVLHDPERFIVIPDISGMCLFDELDELREWLDLPALPMDEMKTNIAEYGGYVPGAIVI